MAINISPKQIVAPSLPNIVSQALSRNKVPGNRIELEVTEGIFLGDSKLTLDVMKRLRALGVGIALDDFGTGYSSIGYLNKAVFHKLKIDGSFVREAGTRPENVAIIQSIVQLAKSFRMNVTAEGVETAEDFERMRDLGVDTIQGYLFGRPLSYERANQMVLGLGATRELGGLGQGRGRRVGTCPSALAHRRVERVGAERLGQQGRVRRGADDRVGLAVSRHEQQSLIGRRFEDPPRHLGARHAGHDEVDDDEVGPLLDEHLQSGLRRRSPARTTWPIRPGSRR